MFLYHSHFKHVPCFEYSRNSPRQSLSIEITKALGDGYTEISGSEWDRKGC